MPRPNKRTRSEKRISKGLQGKNQKIHYRRGANTPRLCHICRQPLAGIRHVPLSDQTKLSKTKRRVWRPYGGQVCHNCLKIYLKQAARSI